MGKSLGYGLIAVCVVAAIPLVYFGISSGCSPKGAKAALQSSIADMLKSPSTADFVGGETIEAVGECFYKISGEVDSQNSFGAIVRSRYSGTVVDKDYKVVAPSVVNR